MNIQEKKKKLDIIMMQYSQLKNDSKNRAKCKALKNQAASIMYSPDFFRMLTTIVKNRIKMIGIPTRYQPDEFISETFICYAETYDHTKNDSFCAFFQYYLKNYTITNMLRKEHPEREINITIEDDEGNEIPYIYTIQDNNEDTEEIAIADILQGFFEKSITVDDANNIIRFYGYLTKIVPCILHVKKHQKGNEKSYQYYSAFATDFFISFCKHDWHLKYDVNENDVFSAIDLKFADFTLAETCRSFSDFKSSSCKEYSDLELFPKPEEKDSEDRQLFCVGKLHIPFRNPVYRVYHHVKDDSSISQQRTKFRNELGKWEE